MKEIDLMPKTSKKNLFTTESLNAFVCLLVYFTLALTTITTIVSFNKFGTSDGLLSLILALLSASFFLISLSLLFSKWVITNKMYISNDTNKPKIPIANGIVMCAAIGGIFFYSMYYIFENAITNDVFFQTAMFIIVPKFILLSYFGLMSIILYFIFFVMSIVTRKYELPRIFNKFAS